MPRYRWMVCPECGWATKIYGHDDPYYCPQCGDEGIDSVLVEEN